MAYVTYSLLENKKDFWEQKANSTDVQMVYVTNRTRIFLSHKHNDEKMVLAIKGYLYEQGIDAYIDWLDPNMPKITNAKTAKNLKDRIKEAKRFILLATDNSAQSIWIPWELGLADGIKGMDSIAIMPVTTDPYNWKEREYYGIYNTLKIGESGGLEVFQSNSNSGIILRDWMNDGV